MKSCIYAAIKCSFFKTTKNVIVFRRFTEIKNINFISSNDLYSIYYHFFSNKINRTNSLKTSSTVLRFGDSHLVNNSCVFINIFFSLFLEILITIKNNNATSNSSNNKIVVFFVSCCDVCGIFSLEIEMKKRRTRKRHKKPQFRTFSTDFICFYMNMSKLTYK